MAFFRRHSVWSDDGKLLLAPCGREVHLFAAATGERVGTLEGHAGDVTCVVLDPQDTSRVRARVHRRLHGHGGQQPQEQAAAAAAGGQQGTNTQARRAGGRMRGGSPATPPAAEPARRAQRADLLHAAGRAHSPCAHPPTRAQAYTAARDGTLRLWNYRALECMRVLHVRETVRSMVRGGRCARQQAGRWQK